jgi:hypothetical protein
VPPAAHSLAAPLGPARHRHHLIVEGVERGQHEAAAVRRVEPERGHDPRPMGKQEEVGEGRTGEGGEGELGVLVCVAPRAVRDPTASSQRRSQPGPGECGSGETTGGQPLDVVPSLGPEHQERFAAVGAHRRRDRKWKILPLESEPTPDTERVPSRDLVRTGQRRSARGAVQAEGHGAEPVLFTPCHPPHAETIRLESQVVGCFEEGRLRHHGIRLGK